MQTILNTFLTDAIENVNLNYDDPIDKDISDVDLTVLFTTMVVESMTRSITEYLQDEVPQEISDSMVSNFRNNFMINE